MSFKKEQVGNYYLLNTHVENLFIGEHMISAPGEYIKVYLFALMYAELNKKLDNAGLAKQLRVAEEDVLAAWTYWENMGVIQKHYIDSNDQLRYHVEFLCLKERLYSPKTMKKAPSGVSANKKVIMGDKGVRGMYASVEKILGRPLSGTEIVEIVSWIEELGALPETVVCAYSFCKKSRKKDHARYVAAVVREWAAQGLLTEEQISGHLEVVDKRHFEYKRILKALGFTRNATEEEKRLMDAWFDDMNFPLDKVLEACSKTSGISNPNMNYVNKILDDWSKGSSGGSKAEKKGVTAAVVFKYYDYIREKAEQDAEERRQEVYQKAPRIREIEEAFRKVSMEISKTMIAGGSDKQKRLAQLQKQISSLNEEKAFLLTEHNFHIDHMDVKYLCPLCKDMGNTQDGERCSCFPQRLSEAEEWQNS